MRRTTGADWRFAPLRATIATVSLMIEMGAEAALTRNGELTKSAAAVQEFESCPPRRYS